MPKTTVYTMDNTGDKTPSRNEKCIYQGYIPISQ